jgi:hypothetical protein
MGDEEVPPVDAAPVEGSLPEVTGNPELFGINNPQTGETFAVRDAPDVALSEARTALLSQQADVSAQINQALQRAANLSALLAVLGYEIDRRQRGSGIILATRPTTRKNGRG